MKRDLSEETYKKLRIWQYTSLAVQRVLELVLLLFGATTLSVEPVAHAPVVGAPVPPASESSGRKTWYKSINGTI